MAYVPPLTELTSLQRFAAHLDDLLPRGEVPPRMAVGEALARAGGYPDAQALHAATKALPMPWQAAVEVPALPGVSARRLRDWTGPLHKALGQAPGGSRLEALAHSWGHRSAFALYWALARQQPVRLFSDYLYRPHSDAAWCAVPAPWSTSTASYLTLGEETSGAQWGVTEARARCHLAVVGPSERQAARVIPWLRQRSEAGEGWGWFGTDRTWAQRLVGDAEVTLLDWTSDRGPDLDLDQATVSLLHALQSRIVQSVLAPEASLTTEQTDALIRFSQGLVEGVEARLSLGTLIGVWRVALGEGGFTGLSVDQITLGHRLAPAMAVLAPLAPALVQVLSQLAVRFSGAPVLGQPVIQDRQRRWVLLVPEATDAVGELIQRLLMRRLHDAWIEQLGVRLVRDPFENESIPSRRTQLWAMALPEDVLEGHEILFAQARAIGLALVVCSPRPLESLMAVHLTTQLWLGPTDATAALRGSTLSAGEGALWVTGVPVPQPLIDPG